MHSKDFASQAMHQTGKQFPRAFEGQKKPKMKIPDFTLEVEKDQASFFSFDTSIQPPPLSTTSCFITETINTDPNLFRSTMYVLPSSTDVFDSMELPLGFVITPFSQKAMPTELESTGAMRCGQCQSYVNLFTRIEREHFYCNICGAKNGMKEGFDNEIMRHSTIEYVSRERAEKRDRSEPANIVSEGLFRTRIVPGPIFILGIDTTCTVLISHIVKGIANLLRDENFKFLFKKIALVLFSDLVSLVKISNGNVTEVLLSDEAQLPFISPEFLTDVEDEKCVELIIEHLRNLNVSGKSGAGLNDCLKVAVSMAGYCGGAKTAIFTNTQEKVTHDIAKSLIEVGNSLNIFSTQRIPVTKVCTLTTGRSFIYDPETLTTFCSDLLSLGTAKSSYGVQIELKTSDAIRKLGFYGNTVFEHLGFQDFAQMDENTTFGVTYSLEESLQNQAKVYVQIILNFCGFDGSNRTLVMNTAFAASTKISEIYANLSFDTLVCIYAKYIAMEENNVKEYCKKVENVLSRSLKFYRDSCCKEASSSQFVLPESIKLVPLVYQSMLKNNSFSNDVNIVDLARITNLTVEQNLRFFYPRLFTFTEFYINKSLDKTKALKLTAESLNSDEIYVMENSQKIYLHVGSQVDESLREAIFAEGTEENSVLRQMIEDVYSHYGYELPVVVVEEGRGGAEIEFIGYLVEDKLNNFSSYSDYICELHFKVKNA